jgi:hypothetical protein
MTENAFADNEGFTVLKAKAFHLYSALEKEMYAHEEGNGSLKAIHNPILCALGRAGAPYGESSEGLVAKGRELAPLIMESLTHRIEGDIERIVPDLCIFVTDGIPRALESVEQAQAAGDTGSFYALASQKEKLLKLRDIFRPFILEPEGKSQGRPNER